MLIPLSFPLEIGAITEGISQKACCILTGVATKAVSLHNSLPRGEAEPQYYLFHNLIPLL